MRKRLVNSVRRISRTWSSRISKYQNEQVEMGREVQLSLSMLSEQMRNGHTFTRNGKSSAKILTHSDLSERFAAPMLFPTSARGRNSQHDC